MTDMLPPCQHHGIRQRPVLRSKAAQEESASYANPPGRLTCITVSRLVRVAAGVLRTFCTFVARVTGMSQTTPRSRMRAVRLCVAVATLRRPL